MENSKHGLTTKAFLSIKKEGINKSLVTHSFCYRYYSTKVVYHRVKTHICLAGVGILNTYNGGINGHKIQNESIVVCHRVKVSGDRLRL